MNGSKYIIGAIGILALCACAPTQVTGLDASAQAAEERMSALFGEEMICQYDQETGSRRVALVCRFEEEVELEREWAQEYARRRNLPDQP